MEHTQNLPKIKNKTWCEKILDCLGDKKWKSRRQIKNALGLQNEKNKNITRAINRYLRRLIVHGYIVRANAPDVIQVDPLDHVNFVYKSTGKVFVPIWKGSGFIKYHTRRRAEKLRRIQEEQNTP